MAVRLRLPRPRRAFLVWGLAALGALFVVVGLWILWPFWQLSGQFAGHLERQPSRLYARPTVLSVDGYAPPDELVAELDEAGYRRVPEGRPLPPGTYRLAEGVLTVHQRSFPTPSGMGGAEVLEIAFRGRRVRSLTLGGREAKAVPLDPPLLASYYGDDLEERRPVHLDQVPEELVDAVLAAEDDGFFRHGGISPAGVARAAWVNLRGGEIRQGGSTITQQLVKNLYLTHERSVGRKLREAMLALLLEARHGKREILQAYLNEIYLGAGEGVNLIGVGAASWAYFGKRVSELDLGEAATLAGMIQAPANYLPTTKAEAARQRRDWVLSRMVELGTLDAERAELERLRPVVAAPQPVVRRRAPYFAAAMAREAADRFGIEGLDDAGYVLLSTVDRDQQLEAEKAVGWGLEALEEGWQKKYRGEGPLQAALVSADPRTGGLLAYVGGRDFGASQFDRAGQARRQAGSAFKPVVYAAAFERGLASPASLIEDSPLTVRLAGQRWEPQNYDQSFHGWVTVRTALEQSLNVATARMALQVGLPEIVDLARKLGVTAPLDPVPALALGAFELSPLELTTVYASLAAAGRRPTLHGLAAVYDPRGAPVEGRPVPAPEPVLSPQTAYLLTSMLEGVLDHGTGSSARQWGFDGALAGKTGTTNGRRDSWFAGYSPDRVTLVWVGYDDNSTTNLSGARAALPIWTRFTTRVRPAAGWPTFEQPPGIVTAVIDPSTGELATEDCPQAVTEVFRQGQVPDRVCQVHQRWWSEPMEPTDDGGERSERPRRRRIRRWLDRVFGDG